MSPAEVQGDRKCLTMYLVLVMPARSGAPFGGFCEREFAPEEMFHTISSALSTCMSTVCTCWSCGVPYCPLATHRKKEKRKT